MVLNHNFKFVKNSDQNLNKFEENDWMVSAEELRQYFYCPRIPFFRHIRHIYPAQTYLMKRGSDFHEKIIRDTPKKEKSLMRLTSSGEEISLFYDYYIESKKLHLLALLDLFGKIDEKIFPIEIKTSSKPPEGHNIHHYIQLTAQSLLLEEYFNTFINHARIVYLESKEKLWVPISIDMKEKVLSAIKSIHKGIKTEILPNPTADHEKCIGCEFWAFCRRI